MQRVPIDMSADITDNVSDLDTDIGISEGHSTSGDEASSPPGRHRPPFLNLNLDRDSGVVLDAPQGNTVD